MHQRKTITPAGLLLASLANALDFTELIPMTLPRSAMFRQEGSCLWDPCVIRTQEVEHHLLYSRWPRALGTDAWARGFIWREIAEESKATSADAR